MKTGNISLKNVDINETLAFILPSSKAVVRKPDIHLIPETLSVSKEVISHSMKTVQIFKTTHTRTIKKICAGTILSVNFQLYT